MLGQLERPAASLLTLYSAAVENTHFATYCRAFETGQTQRHQNNYQANGVDDYFLIVAQRYGDLLVVNFTGTKYQPRMPVEQALRES